MPYGITYKPDTFKNSITYEKPDGLGGTVQQTDITSGSYFTRHIQRLGNNNPLNGPLLFFRNNVRPKRVSSYVKKEIIGYRWRRRKKAILISKMKRVFSHYTYRRVLRLSRKKKLAALGKYVWVRKRSKHYRYVRVTKLVYRSYSERVPIKVRVRHFFVVKSKGINFEGVPPVYDYLLPTNLTYTDVSVSAVPRTVSAFNVPFDLGSSVKILGVSSEGYPSSAFNAGGFSIGVGRGPFSVTLPLPPPVDDIYLSATSLYGLYTKVSSQYPQTVTSLAEAPETVKQLYKLLSSGLKLAKSLRKFDLKSAYNALNSVSKQRNDSLSGLSSKVWLNWYLAVAPTISDISEHLSFLSNRDTRVWRKYSKSYSTVEQYRFDDPTSNYFQGTDSVTTIKWSVIISGKFVIDDYRDQFSNADVLTSGLYAIVPFSFIADWGVNISNWLNSAHVLDGKEYTAWKTSARSYSESERGHLVAGSQFLSGVRSKVLFQSFRVDREPVTDLPDMPLIPWKKSIATETEINRTLTSLALFRVLGSRKN